MKERSFYIDSSPDQLVVMIKKDQGFNFFQLFTILLLMFGALIAVLFIYNSIVSPGAQWIKIGFVFFGFLMLWLVHIQLKKILLYTKGTDKILIDSDFIEYKATFGILTTQQTLKLDSVNNFQIIQRGKGEFSQASNLLFEIIHGVIAIEKSKRKRIIFGQSLQKDELIALYEEIKKKIPQH